MMYRKIKWLLASVAVVVLVGCGSIVELPNSGTAPSLYNLTALDNPRGQGTDKMLMIEDPTSIGGLDERYIARRPSPNELQYFGGVRWHTRASNMVQATLAESLEKTGQHVSVGRGGAVVPSKYELQIEIRDFQAEYYASSTVPDVHLRMAVTLVQLVPLKVIGSQEVNVSERAYDGTMTSVIAAFDRAHHDVLDQIIGWSLPLIASQD